jgi:hypothetical protein
MPFGKGKSGNPKGSVRGKRRAKRGSGVWSKAAQWALQHMEDQPGTEGEAPSGAAKAMLREARENTSKFLDRVERAWRGANEKAAAGKEQAVSAQDLHYGEVVERLLKEFEDAQPRTMGRGGAAQPNGKSEVSTVH